MSCVRVSGNLIIHHIDRNSQQFYHNTVAQKPVIYPVQIIEAYMNILFFLTPKSDVAYIFEDETLRQALEKMENRKYSCIPLLSPAGKYTGTISEGDLLWGMRHLNLHDLKDCEEVSIMAIPRRATYKPVRASANIEDLLDCAINQNFVPVVDDQGYFIGLVTRKEILKYGYREYKKAVAKNGPPEEDRE